MIESYRPISLKTKNIRRRQMLNLQFIQFECDFLLSIFLIDLKTFIDTAIADFKVLNLVMASESVPKFALMYIQFLCKALLLSDFWHFAIEVKSFFFYYIDL